jgi:uncharacterized Ntn-hydrolase superfamily protein
VAVASKFPAVGAVVPWARAEAGAVATQSFANTSFGPRGLDLMAKGLSAEKSLARLLARDPEREKRQVGLVDRAGQAASFTGQSCFEWAGGLTGPGYAVQGNLLTGPEVVQSMEKAFRETKGDLPARLYAALLAGSLAGGDRRGRQSAALYVVKPHGGYGGHLDRWIDYRVDDHIDPIPRLGELLEMHHLYFGRSPVSQRVKLHGSVVEDLQKIMMGLGYYCPVNGRYDDTTREAFRAFIGNENFEERASPDKGWIDRPVLEYLLKKFPKQ